MDSKKSNDNSLRCQMDSEQKKLGSIRNALCVLSCVAVLFGGGSLVAVNQDHPDVGFGLMVIFALLGVYIFIGTLETTVLRDLVGLRASVITWGTLVFCAVFVAKSKAAADINQIFHVDASIFAMTWLAVTALQTLSFMFWFVLCASVLMLLVAIVWRKSFFISSDGVSIFVTIIISAIGQLAFAGIVHGWINADGQRKNLVYRIAQYADFYEHYRCLDVPDGRRVVFVDSQKTRVLVAPEIVEKTEITALEKTSWLKGVVIPKEFLQADCVPPIPKPEDTSGELSTYPQIKSGNYDSEADGSR